MYIESFHLIGAPFIHLHLCMTKEDSAQSGFTIIEICCHGCGAAVLVWLDYLSGAEISDVVEGKDFERVKLNFFDVHCHCDSTYLTTPCPSFRTSLQSVDLRKPVRYYTLSKYKYKGRSCIMGKGK